MDSKAQAEVARQAEIDAVLTEFDGDARAAIAALLWDLEALARDRENATSYGFTRGKISIYNRKHCLAFGRVDSNVRVEAWDEKGRIIAVIAHCDSISVGRAAFDAAIRRYPNQEVTLRDACRVIARQEPAVSTSTG
ncbi:MAG: hypothetical protein IOC63_09380 [Methylobacterium sp.]|nr:hypothetical protein [Methylobacterium sp.]MCA3602602.1 hypothetical protein [Methylobacterium sp.]MCA3613680.1 hypothetical protein [Methylobacterium sp.]MCA3642052.1 hypothetical protein [Methylobacterium sp.]